MSIKYKDYEYGWYGFHGTYNNIFMNTGYYNIRYYNIIKKNNKKKESNGYNQSTNNTLKQLPYILDVKFISGNYKDVI